MAGTLNSSPFRPSLHGSSSPTVQSTLGSSGILYAFQSTGLREWQFPSNRSVLFTEFSGADYWINIGTSDVVCVANTLGIPILGGTQQVFTLSSPSQTHFAFASSTSVIVNATIGHGY